MPALFTKWKRKMFKNSCRWPEYFGILAAAWSAPLHLRKNLLATAGNLKVNKQIKYKSVPIFFYS